MFSKTVSRRCTSTTQQAVQVRYYAKKGGPTPAAPQTPPTPAAPQTTPPPTQTKGKAVPAPPPVQDRLFDINLRDLWKKREYDLTAANTEALNAFLTQSAALRLKHITATPTLRGVIDADVAIATQTTDDVARPAVRVAVTGAAGAIGYALLARLASGAAFGPKRKIIFHLLELPGAMNALKGVEMELRDSAFPLVEDIVITDSAEKAFEGIDYALLVGAMPRKEGMERKDLLLKNAEIFAAQGKVLSKVGKGKGTRVAVVGNPANTNAMIAQRNAPNIPPENFMAMTRLDHNRAVGQLSLKTNTPVADIRNVIIWGNHSTTQVPDINHAAIGFKPAAEVVNDPKWVEEVFIPTVQKRGAAIIKARKASSAASAASSLVDMVRDWESGTPFGTWTSGAVFSNGEYGIEKGLFFSYPILHSAVLGGQWSVVDDLSWDEATAIKIQATVKELKEERDGVAKYL